MNPCQHRQDRHSSAVLVDYRQSHASRFHATYVYAQRLSYQPKMYRRLLRGCSAPWSGCRWRWKRPLYSLREQVTNFGMHIDSCPRCGAPGYMVKKYRKLAGRRYGPYLEVQHYASKSPRGTTRVKSCFISLKRLHSSQKTRIFRLLAAEKRRETER